MGKQRGLTFDAIATYQISVQGHLDQSWSDRMYFPLPSEEKSGKIIEVYSKWVDQADKC